MDPINKKLVILFASIILVLLLPLNSYSEDIVIFDSEELNNEDYGYFSEEEEYCNSNLDIFESPYIRMKIILSDDPGQSQTAQCSLIVEVSGETDADGNQENNPVYPETAGWIGDGIVQLNIPKGRYSGIKVDYESIKGWSWNAEDGVIYETEKTESCLLDLIFEVVKTSIFALLSDKVGETYATGSSFALYLYDLGQLLNDEQDAYLVAMQNKNSTDIITLPFTINGPIYTGSLLNLGTRKIASKVLFQIPIENNKAEAEDLLSNQGLALYTKFKRILGYHVGLNVNKTACIADLTAIKSDIAALAPPNSDSDVFPDWFEVKYGLNPNDPTDGVEMNDNDNDSVININEYEARTNPNNVDTDNDDMPDGWELTNLLDPLIADNLMDPDNDGVDNHGEYWAGSDPNNEPVHTDTGETEIYTLYDSINDLDLAKEREKDSLYPWGVWYISYPASTSFGYQTDEYAGLLSHKVTVEYIFPGVKTGSVGEILITLEPIYDPNGNPEGNPSSTETILCDRGYIALRLPEEIHINESEIVGEIYEYGQPTVPKAIEDDYPSDWSLFGSFFLWAFEQYPIFGKAFTATKIIGNYNECVLEQSLFSAYDGTLFEVQSENTHDLTTVFWTRPIHSTQNELTETRKLKIYYPVDKNPKEFFSILNKHNGRLSIDIDTKAQGKFFWSDGRQGLTLPFRMKFVKDKLATSPLDSDRNGVPDYWQNNPPGVELPYFANPSVSPTYPNDTDNVIFTIDYFDNDGDEVDPNSVKVIVDGSNQISMSEYYNQTYISDGQMFSKGSHNYYFIGSQGGQQFRYPSGSGSLQFYVYMVEDGHDVGVDDVSWDSNSAYNPNINDLIVTKGEPIRINAVAVYNYGSYSEVNVPVLIEIVDSNNGVVKANSNTLYLSSIPASESEILYGNLYINTGDFPELIDGQYKLRVRTNLSNDADHQNDCQEWTIYMGNPYPPSGHLPLQSYRYFRYVHNTTATPSTPVLNLGGGYSIRVTYVNNNQVEVDLIGNGCSSSQPLLTSDEMYSLCSDNVFFYLAGAYQFGNLYFIEFNVGIYDPNFQMDNYIRQVYRYSGSDELSLIDNQYKGKYDYYLPAGWSNGDAYLHCYNPFVNAATLDSYIHKWSYADRNTSGSQRGDFGGSLLMGYSFISSGVIDNYYVIVPTSSIPIGDYNFLILQERDISVSDNTLQELGRAHSIRMRVENFHDVSLESIQLPPTITSGDEVVIDVNVKNDGDINEPNALVNLNISNNTGYVLSLDQTVSINKGATKTVNFNWNTLGLSAGVYEFNASVIVPDDSDSSNNNSSTQKNLLPPPELSITCLLDKTSYSEGELILLTATTVVGSSVTYLVKDNTDSVIGSGSASDPENDGSYNSSFNAPILPGDYTVLATATKIGYLSGNDVEAFTVNDTQPPTTAILLSPTYNEYLTDPQPSFDWLDSSDAGSGVSGYEIEVDDDSDFSSPAVEANTTVSSYPITSQLQDGTYYWRVRAKDNVGNPIDPEEGWSESVFYIDTTIPSITITFPDENPMQTDQLSISVSGTAGDNIGVASITWTNDCNQTEGNVVTSDGWATWGATIDLCQGQNNLSFTVYDSAGNTKVIDIVVNCIEHKITFNTQPSGNPNPVASGETVQCATLAEDSWGHDVNYQWSSSVGTFNNSALKNSIWAAPQNNTGSTQSYDIIVTATCVENGDVSETDYYQQDVLPEPPVIEPISDHSINEGEAYTGPTPVLSQGGSVIWILSNGPAGMGIDPNTGVVTWQNPIYSEIPYTITIQAINDGGSDEESWMLTVNCMEVTWFKDADNDGYSDGTSIAACERPLGYKLDVELIATSGDCDDDDVNEHPGQIWYKDLDQDGYSDGITDTSSCERPDNYKIATELIATSGDCDDDDANEHQGQTWYKDIDDDGYSDGTMNTSSCERPDGYKIASELIKVKGDCDDNDPDKYPGNGCGVAMPWLHLLLFNENNLPDPILYDLSDYESNLTTYVRWSSDKRPEYNGPAFLGTGRNGYYFVGHADYVEIGWCSSSLCIDYNRNGLEIFDFNLGINPKDMLPAYLKIHSLTPDTYPWYKQVGFDVYINDNLVGSGISAPRGGETVTEILINDSSVFNTGDNNMYILYNGSDCGSCLTQIYWVELTSLNE